MEAGLLDAAPIWTDLKTFPWSDFRGVVDILSGGYPCQPFSAAGKRLGHEDPRHLWPFIADGIAAMRPRLCFFENVEGHISLGLREVIGELENLGYQTAWGIFSAAEVGAPHQRKRVFILAYRHGERGQLSDRWRVAAEQVPIGDGEERGASPMAHAGSARTDSFSEKVWSRNDTAGQPSHPWPSRPGEPQHGWEPPRVIVGDTGSEGHARAARKSGARAQRQSLGHTAEPDACVGNTEGGQSNGRVGAETSERRRGDDAAYGAGEVLGNSNSARPQEWPRKQRAGLQGADADGGETANRQTQPALGGDADGPAPGLGLPELSGLSHSELAEIRSWMERVDNRTDELRLLGNGVLPATAEAAFRTLFSELVEDAK